MNPAALALSLIVTTGCAAFAHPQQLTTTIFICAVNIAPDRCNAETAIDVTAGPNVDNEIMCGKLGQAVIAGTALAPRAGIEYVKITCSRRRG